MHSPFHYKHITSLIPALLISLLLGSAFAEETPIKESLPPPLSGALYIDAWHLEKEILISAPLLASLDSFTLFSEASLSPEKRQELKPLLISYFQEHLPITYDGAALTFTPEQVRFIRPETSELILIEDDETLPISEVTVSLTYSASLPHPRGSVGVTWDLFPSGIDSVDLLVADDVATRTLPLTPTQPKAEITPRLFQNSENLPSPPAIPGNLTLKIPWLSLLLLVPLLILLGKAVRTGQLSTASLITMLGLVFVAALAQRFLILKIDNPFISQKIPTETESKVIAHSLLRNVYHSFDFRDEEEQYEILRNVTDGQTLTEVYLEARRTLLQRQKNGSRVRVTDLEVEEAAITENQTGNGFITQCRWVTRGKVGHWGHFHQRTNSYQANLSIAPRDNTWKLISLELLSADRKP